MRKYGIYVGIFILLALITILPDMLYGEKVRVVLEQVNVRLKPSHESTILTQLKKGTILDTLEKTADWFIVKLPPDENGYRAVGYIHSSVVERVEAEPAKEMKPEEKLPIRILEEPIEPSSAKGGFGFGIKISGGAGFILMEELKKAHDGLWQYRFDSYNEEGGHFKSPRIGMDFEGEFLLFFSRNIGIGVGAGYSQGKVAKGNISYISPSTLQTSYVNDEWTIKTIPLILNLHFSFPLGNTLGFGFNLGGGYYLGMISYHFSYDTASYDGTVDFNASQGTIGFQGGIECDINLNPSIALFMDAQGRYAKLTHIEGDYVWEETFVTTTRIEEKSTLWYIDRNYMIGLYPHHWFSKDKPEAYHYHNVHELEVDLSGVSIRAGVKIRF
ncbi:MAG: SH3 domain-containing protein [Candidatus Aminicenantes bacterium]|nr:SH3 domain-containing protein [Candidatus Aminicenantes bacterium]